MSDNKDNQANGDSLVKLLVVPILITLIAGGTSPWWIHLFQGDRNVNEVTTATEGGSTGVPQSSEGFQDNDSSRIQGTDNTLNDHSVHAQGSGSQSVVQGTGNTIVQGEGNQLTIRQESDARSRGEANIPALYGLSYHEARAILLEEGWIPSSHRHTYYQEEIRLQNGNSKRFWDLGYWEVVTCSGTGEGFCRFEFSDPSGRRLVIITAGMEEPSIPAQAGVRNVFLNSEPE